MQTGERARDARTVYQKTYDHFASEGAVSEMKHPVPNFEEPTTWYRRPDKLCKGRGQF